MRRWRTGARQGHSIDQGMHAIRMIPHRSIALHHHAASCLTLVPPLWQSMFPHAKVETECTRGRTVKISELSVQKKPLDIVEVSQRDLYQKYRWPAAQEVTDKLEIFKDTYGEEAD